MVRIDLPELVRAIKLLEKESSGGSISIKEDGAVLKIATTDHGGQELEILLTDTETKMKPRVTKTTTF